MFDFPLKVGTGKTQEHIIPLGNYIHHKSWAPEPNSDRLKFYWELTYKKKFPRRDINVTSILAMMGVLI